ncbi:MAG: AMP-binding protein [Proteobacteria bacterium]|nr:AMP-binding protein [Pseudomonadota bacterium]
METIAQLIARRGAERSDATFLMFNDRTVTFGELAREVKRWAAAFHAFGVRAGDRVGLMMTNHPEHIFMYLGLSWIGAINIEHSVHLKKLGLETQLSDCDPRFVIGETTFAGELKPSLAAAPTLEAVLWWGPDAERVAAEGVTGAGGRPVGVRALEHLVRAEHPAIEPVKDLARIQTISYTSGTTGLPKGAMLTERYFLIGAGNAAILADARSDDVLFMWEPFFHMAGWMTVLISLMHGIPIGMVERFSGTRCWDQIRAYKATLLHYLGGAMNILLKQPPRPDDADNPIRVAWGGAAPTQNWREFERRFGVTIHECYGLSEGQNMTHMNLEGRVGSIGCPVSEFDAWAEDDNGRRLGASEVGELVLKPKQPNITMSGYFRNEAKTAEVLRNGCVYTGDLVSVDADGYFYFTGRKKDALRRRGENVSAWEVERVLNAHPTVEESAVIGVPSEMGEQDIKAFVKPAAGETADAQTLIAWCQQHLAYYQVPRYLAVVDEFPRGPTQRIQKTLLSQSVADCFDAEKVKPGRA